MIFELHEDVKVSSWRRYFYDVDADTLEEAVRMVKDGIVDSTDMEELYEVDCYMKPEDNNGEATREIYSSENSELLYANGRHV